MGTQTTIHLAPSFFGERKRTLVEQGTLSASIFRFGSGVCGIKLSNDVGHLVMLPFQGQQIWDASFGGRTLTMVSMFDEPQPTRQRRPKRPPIASVELRRERWQDRN